jgi:hypothetical protein
MHSLKRAQEYQLTVDEVVGAWYRSSKYTLPKGQDIWKFQVYGMRSVDDMYFYDAATNLLFTCSEKEPYTLVLTITKRD